MEQGQVDPAMMKGPKDGQEARGKILAGLGLETIRRAIPMFPADSSLGIMLAEVTAKLGKEFAKPPEDLGQAELKFLQSQLYPQQQRPAAMDSGAGIQQSLMQQGAPSPGAQAAGMMMAGASAAGGA